MTAPRSNISRGLPLALILALAWLLPSSASGQTGDRDSEFRRANAAFDQGDFGEASTRYRDLVGKGHSSPDLYYNLGTSLFREGKPGEAMLWFRRARLLDSNLPEVEQNTEFLRQRIAFLEFADDGFEQFLRSISPGAITWITSILLWLGLISIGLAYSWPFFRQFSSRWISLGAVFLMLALVCFRIGNYRESRVAPENFATVTAAAVEAKTAPTPDAKAVIELPPGSEVRLLQQDGPWSYVDIPGNLRGWLRSEDVEPNWPIPPTSPAPSKNS